MNKFYKRILKENFPYIVAEIGSNHNGSLKLGQKMILAAKKAGADCVKFQSWSKDSLYSKKVYSNDKKLEKTIDKLAVTENLLIKFYKYSKKIGIDFTSTPFSKTEVDFLIKKVKVPFVKIASMDLVNLDLIEYVAKRNIPIVISNGLSEIYEIDKTIKLIEKYHKQIIILHCVASYPTSEEKINLNNIDTLSKIYPYPIGFSDHSLGFAIPIASVVKGVKLIEKHFTIDKKLDGWDQSISADPHELKIICDETKKVYKSLGTQYIKPFEEKNKKNIFRRSIVLTKNISKGTILNKNLIVGKRPGDGIPIQKINDVINRKTKRDIKANTQLKWSDLE